MSERDRHDDLLAPLRDLDPTGAAPRFSDRLEAELRVGHAAARRPPSAPWRRAVVLAPALLLLVIVATTTLVLRDDAVSVALELTDAHNVVVTLPDGTTVTDPVDGFLLVDGATVTIGIDGRATIDEVTLGSGTVVTVRDGVLVTDVIGTTTSTARSGDGAPTDEPARPTGPAPSVGPAPPSSTERPPLSTTPSADSPRDGGPGPDSETTDEPEPPVGEVELALHLQVLPRDGNVLVTWRADGAEQPWRTVLLRRLGDGPPSWPVLDGTVVLAESSGGDPGEFVDQQSGPDSVVQYRIAVIDADDGLIAESAVQTLARR